MMRSSIPVLLCAVPIPDRVPGLVKTLKDGKPGERIVAAEVLADLERRSFAESAGNRIGCLGRSRS
jgi:hypothetical protein